MENSVQLFSEKDKAQAFKTKRIMLIVWFSCLALFLAIVITLMVLNYVRVEKYFDRSYKALFMAISIILATVFAGGSMFFFAIKFRLTAKYVRMLKDIARGLKAEDTVKFIAYESDIITKDGVFFYNMVVDAKPIKREDITTRKVLIERTIEPPKVTEGQKLKITTHANILLSYTILE